MSPGRKLARGSDVNVYEYGSSEVLKIPRRLPLMNLVFGDFRLKNEHDTLFLQTHFAAFVPPTQIVDLPEGWGIRQRRVSGIPFFVRPRMTPAAHDLLSLTAATYRTTGYIPDLLSPGNLLCEAETGRLLLVDTSVLGGGRSWPCGFLASRLLGRGLFDTMQRWLRSGFPTRTTVRD